MVRESALTFLIVSLTIGQGIAQGTSRKGGHSRELEGVAENDILFLADYYYTAGHDFVYRRLVRPGSAAFNIVKGSKQDSVKVIVHYRLGLKIFNPYDIDAVEPPGMDRPYAGWISGGVGLSTFRSPRHGNRVELETGLVGSATGMERLQLWVHKLTTYDPPMGWEYQIRNEWVVNLYYVHCDNWKLAEDADIVSQSSVQAGTGGNKLSQDFTLRLIQFNPVNNSAFTQSRLSWDSPTGKAKHELFIFGGIGVDYVISSIFIEGSIFPHHESEFTVPAEPWVFRRSVGIMYSNIKISCSATFNHLTKEVGGGIFHDYASLRLALRF